MSLSISASGNRLDIENGIIDLRRYRQGLEMLFIARPDMVVYGKNVAIFEYCARGEKQVVLKPMVTEFV